MKAEFGIADPHQVQCTMTITMSLGAWIALRDRLGGQSSHPEWQLRQEIYKLVDLAKAKFSSVSDEPQP